MESIKYFRFNLEKCNRKARKIDRERERDERNIFMVELSPVPDLEGYKYENLLF